MTPSASWLDAFEPPSGLVGWAAALVAMTAEPEVLDEMTTRFCAAGPRSRAASGVLTAWLLQDPHRRLDRDHVLAPGLVAGLLELAPRPVPARSLLHAKLALLGYAPHLRAPAPTHLRLLVYTGNFTRASLRHQLELVCRWDVRVGAAPAPDAADVAAAAAFVEALVETRYWRPDEAGGALTGRLDTLIRSAGRVPTGVEPRFVHSLGQPLFPQLRRRFRRHPPTNANFLLAGSGFFEKGTVAGAEPTVLAKLQDLAPLSASPIKELLVEARQAGAVGTWAQGRGAVDGWTLRAPTDPLEQRRSLHAKFVLVGQRRRGMVYQGCLYLGSGNLSRRGLLTAGTQDAGNIECGVALCGLPRLDADALASLFWRSDAGAAQATPDQEAEPEPEGAELVAVCPILSAREGRREGRAVLALRWRDDAAPSERVSVWLHETWLPATPGEGLFPMRAGECPARLRVRLEPGVTEWWVPVVDAAGRACWERPIYASLWEALDALLEWPVPPPDADGRDGDADEGEQTSGVTPPEPDDDPGRHPLYEAAEFIERLAARQASISTDQVDAWLEHLDRMLAGRPPPRLIQGWRAARLDVLRTLAVPELSPPMLSDVQRARYCAVLDGRAAEWGAAR